jgi:hypothetical protein
VSAHAVVSAHPRTRDNVPVSTDAESPGARLPGAIRLPDGCHVRGRGLRRPMPEPASPGRAGPAPVPDYGLYLGTSRMRRRLRLDPPWPHRWIDWPDFLLPTDREDAVRQIHALHERARAGERVEVGCGGGVGRTGTVIACLAVIAGVPPAGAVAWTRANYHRRAVETPWQRRWVARFPPRP